MNDSLLQKLCRFLDRRTAEHSAVVMPDFFLDRIINLNCGVKTFSENLEKVARRKGGSLDGVRQAELRGGNTVNTASALAALGWNVTPIVCTDKLGKQLISLVLKSNRIDLSHVKISERPSLTTAIELKTEKGKVNVMLRDVGALGDFGPQNLDRRDFEAVEKADYVCVFNWAGTRHFGTKLAQTVFRHVKAMGIGKTYYDTADPTSNSKKIPELVRSVLQSRQLDILSVNENEAIWFAKQVSERIEKLGETLRFEELAKESARILATCLTARVDLHATAFSATFTRNGETIIPAFKVPVLRVTGAGDAWNAGNMLGDAYKLSDDCRLTLANAVAAYYISSPHGTHPNRKQLAKFCEKQKRKNP